MTLRAGSDLTPSDRWRQVRVEPRGTTQLGVSFRPLQAAAMGLEPRRTLATLLTYPFDIVRLGALWSRMEPRPARWNPAELDEQVEAAERAGKRLVLGVGAVKNFGYPEFFVPGHRLPEPLPEGRLVTPASHPDLLDAALEFVSRIVERYRKSEAILAWQVEHEAVDPLGLEHSWRLAGEFVEREIQTVRALDPDRPVLLNGFLPTTLPVRVMQWWRTRDQGDSLALAARLADIVGIDFYPRHAVAGVRGASLYLDGGRSRWRVAHPRVMVSEGQAEPWETVTVPPARPGRHPYSCPPERVIANYNRGVAAARAAGGELVAYLFWGAEYWLRRHALGDPAYVGAFERVLTES